MKTIEKFYWVIMLAIATPFVIYAAGTIIPQYDGYIVTSGSMEPEIQTGSLLYTYNTDAENINVGDTITYREGDNFVTHKVIEKSNRSPHSFRTKGVANAAPDPGRVAEKDIQGKKLFSIPFLGRVASWAGSITGFTALVLLPATLIVAKEVKNIFKEMKTQQNNDRVKKN